MIEPLILTACNGPTTIIKTPHKHPSAYALQHFAFCLSSQTPVFLQKARRSVYVVKLPSKALKTGVMVYVHTSLKLPLEQDSRMSKSSILGARLIRASPISANSTPTPTIGIDPWFGTYPFEKTVEYQPTVPFRYSKISTAPASSACKYRSSYTHPPKYSYV
jgi:hypothetical protein